MRLWLVVLLVACGRDDRAAAQYFTEVPVDTAPGLSGLAADDHGGIWTIAERDEKGYRITLDAQLKPTIETFVVDALPSGFDLEGIAWLGPDHFAFGTEGRQDDVATVLLAERRDGKLVVTSVITIPATRVGIELPANHGTEGICGTGNTILAGIEATGVVDNRRWAPIVRIVNGTITRVHRMWLTTRTGKISALDCTIAADGTAEVLAIERHFEVTKILKFTLPDADGDITPIEVLDLGPVLKSRLNLEGIARTSDGRVVAVVDNQWKTITGPSLLLVFQPSAVK